MLELIYFFFNDTATTEIYTLSLHDALPIWCATTTPGGSTRRPRATRRCSAASPATRWRPTTSASWPIATVISTRRPSAIRRSEEHTSELQSRQYLVCRLLLEKKNTTITYYN